MLVVWVSLVLLLRSFQASDRELEKRVMMVIKNAVMTASEIIFGRVEYILVNLFLCYNLPLNLVFKLRK